MIIEQLNAKLKEGMIAKDQEKTIMIRMILSAIHNREIEIKGKGENMKEEDVLDVLKKELKKRKESADIFGKAGRQEMAEKELREAEFVSSFLPVQLSENEIGKIVDEVLKDFSNPTPKDFGTIMKAVMVKTDGKADGSAVSEIIKEKIK